MFTGIIEEIGTIEHVLKGAISARLFITADNILDDVKLGDSISVNGVCLTVTDVNSRKFTADVMAETMSVTNLKHLSPGSSVNLERALRLGDRLDGHIVSGHIDGTGVITAFKPQDNAVWITVKPPAVLLKYIVLRGSIALDGVSLTIAYIDGSVCKVSIIPHTKKSTTLLQKKTGDKLNIECDVLGKYVEKLQSPHQTENNKSSIDLGYLQNHGFA